MTKQKTNKTIFAVIDLANNEKDQTNVAKYAAEFAKAFGLDLVLYAKQDGKVPIFTFRKAIDAAKKIPGLQVFITKKKINLFSIYASIHDIATQKHAAFIIMGMDNKSAFSLGKTIWSITNKTIIPTILLPKNSSFVPYKNITIAVDNERKLQKLDTALILSRAFGSRINIFTENSADPLHRFLFRNSVDYAMDYLTKHNVSYTKTDAKKTKNFPKHLCKFSAKRSDVLIIEVDPGKTSIIVKQNIGTLLNIETYVQPIIFTKTRPTGLPQKTR
ncbi:MAG: hypothetical protein WC010_03970 [Candidatus Absconditabacterales bacterium]